MRTRAALVAAGQGAGTGDARVRAGAWVRAAPSTYLLPGAQLTDRCRAACAHAGDGAVVTGWAACRLLRLPYVDDGGAVPVLVPAARQRVSTAHVRVLPTTCPPRWWRHPCGLRVAEPARAVVDAARALPDLQRVRALVLGASSLVPVPAMRAQLHDGARRGRALLTRALDDAESGAASCPEAEVADLLTVSVRARRLPGFLLNPDVLVDGVFLGRPDGWLLGLALGWEVDSREFHAGEGAFEATLARSDSFLARGIPLLHVTPRRLRDRRAPWERVVEAAAAARAGLPEPPGLLVRLRGPVLPRTSRR